MQMLAMWELISKAVKASGAIELFILYLLVAFSIASWALILMKIRSLMAAKRNNKKLLDMFGLSETVGEFTPPAVRGPAPLAAVFNSAVDTIEKAGHSGVKHVQLSPEKLHEKVMMRMQHTSKEEMGALKWGSGFLATVGSASPFIGLLGTVWGIMATFQALGDAKSASLAVVAPMISSALIATAAGLAVAIPAVMAYNWILSRIDLLQEEADTFMERMDFMTRTEYAGGVPAKSGAESVERAPTVVSEPVLHGPKV
jgi:biopolymer transport protein TolQ